MVYCVGILCWAYNYSRYKIQLLFKLVLTSNINQTSYTPTFHCLRYNGHRLTALLAAADSVGYPTSFCPHCSDEVIISLGQVSPADGGHIQQTASMEGRGYGEGETSEGGS